MISARCVARDLHTIALGPLGDGSRRNDEIVKTSRTAPLNAIIIIIIVVVVLVVVIVIIIIIVITHNT